MSAIQWGAFGVQQAIMWLLPIGLAIWVIRRYHVPAVMYFIAAGFYLINLAIQIPFNFILWPTVFRAAPLALAAAITLTYAVCEEVMRYLSFRAGKTMRANRTANGALLAGLGHGGTESMLFALQSVAALGFALTASGAYKAQAAATLAVPAWSIVAVGVERIFALIVHMAFATLIVLAYRRSWLMVLVAIALHWALDFTTIGLAGGNFVLAMGLFAAWALVALAFLLIMRRWGLLQSATPAGMVTDTTAPAPLTL